MATSNDHLLGNFYYMADVILAVHFGSLVVVSIIGLRALHGSEM